MGLTEIFSSAVKFSLTSWKRLQHVISFIKCRIFLLGHYVFFFYSPSWKAVPEKIFTTFLVGSLAPGSSMFLYYDMVSVTLLREIACRYTYLYEPFLLIGQC